MARIFITGSADGLGSLAAQALIKKGHTVTLHARNAQRATAASTACPGASEVLVADLSSPTATKQLAADLNARGPWDAIIHNAGVMRVSSSQTGPEGDLPVLFATNTLAPYILTCLVSPPPKKLIFLSSSMHHGGDVSLRDIKRASYSDSKLHNTMLSFYFARLFQSQKDVHVSSLDPGWVKTKMGGSGASDDLGAAVENYVALAEGRSGGPSGRHWYHERERGVLDGAGDVERQEKLVKELAEISEVEVPLQPTSVL